MREAIRDYAAALAFLHRQVDFERVSGSALSYGEFKLDRMHALLAALGHPERTIPAVHLAGTKGKGSTATMIATALDASGWRVGLFTSPHLSRFEERIRIGDRMIPPEALVRHVERLAQVVDEWRERGREESPTFFELTTALAWLWFVECGLDLVVLETGLGGRLDATNLCVPLVTVITPISLDHTQQLGGTIAAIAGEKAGILKPGIPVIRGASDPEAAAVIDDVARRLGCPCYSLGTEIVALEVAGGGGSAESCWTIRTQQRMHTRMRLSTLGRHQGENLAMALAALDVLEERGFPSREDAVRAALAELRIPARQEIVSTIPLILVDSSHNVASASALARTLAAEPFAGLRKTLVYASSHDKDIAGQLRLLAPHFETVLLTRYSHNPRACPPAEIARMIEWPAGRIVEVIEPAEFALSRGLALCGQQDALVIAGSFYLAGELRDVLLRNLEIKNRHPANA